MGFVALAIGVAAAGAVAQGAVSASAAKKANKAQQKALDKVQGVDPEEAQDAARTADTEKFKNQFDLQKQVDPLLSAVRDKGAQAVLDSLMGSNAQSNTVLQALINENKNEDPGITKLRNELISQANQELALGASLPPDVQAELIKAGLERSTQSGMSSDRTSNTGGEIQELVGTAGLQLKRDRQQTASNLGNTAQGLAQARANILSGLITTIENAKSAQQGRGINAVTLGNVSVPNVGLSGNEIVNLMLKNQEIQNSKAIGAGQLEAQRAQSQAQFINSMIGAGTSAATMGLGAYNTGAFGGAASAAPAGTYSTSNASYAPNSGSWIPKY